MTTTRHLPVQANTAPYDLDALIAAAVKAALATQAAQRTNGGGRAGGGRGQGGRGRGASDTSRPYCYFHGYRGHKGYESDATCCRAMKPDQSSGLAPDGIFYSMAQRKATNPGAAQGFPRGQE